MSLFTRRYDREAAYTEYVAARQTQLRRIAYALCGNWAQADDLLQLALVKLYVAWPRIDNDGNPDAYVRKILVRTNIDEHRRGRDREVTGHEGADRAARTDLGIEERSALIDAVQDLPEMQRKVVVLRHWLDLSVAETAAELGIAEGTVKSHSSRGLDTLRGQLTELS